MATDPIDTIARLENAICERLNERLCDGEAQLYPDNPDNWDPIWRGEYAVLVRYNGSSFSGPEAQEIGACSQATEIALTILTRGLRGNSGATGALKACRDALTGFRPEGGAALMPQREGFVLHDGDLWRYEQVFSTLLPYVPPHEPATGPELKRLTLEDQDTDVLATFPREEAA